MVLAFIASEKFAKTLVLRATPGVPSVGLVERTVGEVVSVEHIEAGSATPYVGASTVCCRCPAGT
jgi:hypothetical protein